MKSIYKKGALFAAAALMAFGLSGCGGDSGNASKGPKDTLTVGVTNFADSLEPTDNYFGWQVMRYGIGECLVRPPFCVRVVRDDVDIRGVTCGCLRDSGPA